MKKLLTVAGVGAVGLLVKRLFGRSSPDLTEPEPQQPQRKVEEIEDTVDVPGGVRP